MTTFYKQELLDKARILYDYCPDSGLFFWKINTSNVKAGQVAGAKHNGYIRLTVYGKRIFAHRLAWLFSYGELPKDQIDHIDRNKSNNKITNLRDVDRCVNLQNQSVAHSRNALNILNVSKRPNTGAYKVMINKNKKGFYIGQYKTLKDAVTARDIARIFLNMTPAENNNVYC